MKHLAAVFALSILTIGSILLVRSNSNNALTSIQEKAKVDQGAGFDTDEQALAQPNQKIENHRLNPRRDTAIPNDGSFVQAVDSSVLDKSVIEAFQADVQPLRLSVVTFDSDQLRARIRNEQIWAETNSTPTEPLELQLFDDVKIAALATRSIEYTSTWRNGIARWSGAPIGSEPGKVRITVGVNNEISLVANTRKGRYIIKPSPSLPYHFLWESDQSAQGTID